MRGFYRKKPDPGQIVQGSKVYLGEGKPECQLMDEILFAAGRNPQTHVIFCFEGHGKLSTMLKLVGQKSQELGALFVLLDAETQGFQHRCRLVSRAVTDARIFPTAVKGRPGIQTLGGKQFDFSVSPDNANAGRIEDLILQEIRNYVEWNDIQQFSQSLNAHHAWAVDSKALVQFFISARRPGMCGAASAFEAGILNYQDAAYNNIRNAVLAI